MGILRQSSRFRVPHDSKYISYARSKQHVKYLVPYLRSMSNIEVPVIRIKVKYIIKLLQ